MTRSALMVSRLLLLLGVATADNPHVRLGTGYTLDAFPDSKLPTLSQLDGVKFVNENNRA